MKFRLKLIAFTILSLLVLVCGYQTYWLINFHKEQYSKLERVIDKTIDDGFLKEMAIRLTIISSEKDQGKYVETMVDTVGQNQVISNNKDGASFSMSFKEDTYNGTSKQNKDSVFQTLNYVNVAVKKGLSMTINSIKKPDIHRFDSILTADLLSQDLNIPHVIEIRKTANDSLIDRISKKEFIYKNSQKYPLEDWQDPDYSYILLMENPKWYIFKSMWGLVSVSLLMILLLVISYIYLLIVILKQKSIDEIKSDFVNNMTHELKTPISVTYAAIDAMQNFGLGQDPIKRDEYLSISKEQLLYLNSLVEQILTTSVEERKNLKLALENINIKDIFENQRNKFSLNPHKQIEFILDIKPGDVEIKADKLHFGNMISNLVENAIKYSDESVRIELAAYHSGGKTIIAISDSGIGIPNSSLDKIFDKFYRVSTGNIHNVKGYGLGLSYVKTIVDKHEWDIKVESSLGKGSCFKIIIS
ncbi:MAG: sensor histidine kinase [Dysgonomonas sp.]